MKVLITGGAGFIGNHTTNLFLDAGHQVTVYDDLSKGYKEYVDKRAIFVKKPLENLKALQKAMKGHDGVIHFAAESIIKDSIQNPRKTLGRNFNNALNVLEAMRLTGIKKIVASSSAAVYGETGHKFIEEDVIKEPLQPYGASKLAVEAMFSAYHHAFGMDCTSLRYFNVYGPRDDQLPVTRAVPNWIKAILLDKKIQLYWQGKQARDYIYVKDVAAAHLLAFEKCSGLRYYNIGSGKANTMLDILEAVFKATGKKVPIEDLGERPGDPHRLISDISKIKKELGWKPKVNLDEGMQETVAFYKAHPESLRRI